METSGNLNPVTSFKRTLSFVDQNNQRAKEEKGKGKWRFFAAVCIRSKALSLVDWNYARVTCDKFLYVFASISRLASTTAENNSLIDYQRCERLAKTRLNFHHSTHESANLRAHLDILRLLRMI